MKFTESQKKALEVFKAFFLSNSTFATLSGLGGCGKTFIIKEIIKGFNKRNVLFLAPTHKAKAVLESTLDGEYVCKTVASALGIKLNENTGKFTVDKYAKKIIHKYKVIVVDECSMISSSVYQMLKKDIDLKAKVVFLGDHNQIAPVGETTDSITFTHTIATLTERVRQGDNNPIIPLTDIIIENINSANVESFPAIIEKNDFNLDNDTGVIFIPTIERALKLWAADLKVYPNSTKFITFNNSLHNSPQSVKNINTLCRTTLGYTEDFHIGEVLTAYNAFEDKLVNSTDYYIKELKPHNWKEVAVVEATKYSKERTKEMNLIGYTMVLESEYGSVVKLNVPCIMHKRYIQSHVQELFNAKDFQLAYAILELIPDLEYGYCITANKSQGSTYRNVYVCKNNILKQFNGTNRSRNQAFYVACSRASHNLNLIN